MSLRTDAESGFVDVAANTLAVLIMMTVVVLVVAAIPGLRGEIRGAQRPALPFPVALDPAMPPFSSYWYAGRGGITPIPLGEVSRRVASGETRVETEAGTFFFENARRVYRDLSDYEVGFAPNMDSLAQRATAIDAEEPRAAFVARLATAFRDENRVPTFFVDGKGYEAFARLHADLRAADLPLRWVVVPAGRSLTFLRDAAQFESRMATWR
ncbi:hypothetical protein [Rhodosalinus sediminis]|uniref:hypothetical protein n=1 Tax=Rhodosalinus sediminis TaxID=1940533 RepID=UPI0023579D50|nr:hypothetical protein [Rhodosalinus sediminis]